MELTSQVCSLELAKRLKELGVKGDCTFYWSDEGDENFILKFKSYNKEVNGDSVEWFLAYTVAELGELLPNMIKKVPEDYNEEYIWYLSIEKGTTTGWNVKYICYDYEAIDWFTLTDDSEADARAKMLIYLLENNLVPL